MKRILNFGFRSRDCRRGGRGIAAVALACTLPFPAAGASTITPGELWEKIGDGERVRLIDVRSPAEFGEAHIPGALNIPASLVPEKRLPRLGEVVLYDDGLGRVWAEDVVGAVSAAAGMEARVLEGGFAAWEAAGLSSTRSGGFRSESIPKITYRRVEKAAGRAAVLVDLRKGAEIEVGGAVALSAERDDLTEVFPDIPVIRGIPDRMRGAADEGTEAAPLSGREAPDRERLFILVDDGDGTAEEEARRLRARGFARVVVLAGGDEIVRHRGRPGLTRTETSKVYEGGHDNREEKR